MDVCCPAGPSGFDREAASFFLACSSSSSLCASSFSRISSSSCLSKASSASVRFAPGFSGGGGGGGGGVAPSAPSSFSLFMSGPSRGDSAEASTTSISRFRLRSGASGESSSTSLRTMSSAAASGSWGESIGLSPALSASIGFPLVACSLSVPFFKVSGAFLL